MIQTLFGSLDEEKKPSFIERMKEAVSRTRENLAERIEDVVSIGKEIDRSTLDDLEATLIGADLGTTTTHEVLEKLRDKADRKQIKDVGELKRLLKEELLAILTSSSIRPLTKVDGPPEVIMVVGVNGAGKTTTIGKLAQVFRSQGKTVLMCAADTFRAAAIEQLEHRRCHHDRSHAPIARRFLDFRPVPRRGGQKLDIQNGLAKFSLQAGGLKIARQHQALQLALTGDGKGMVAEHWAPLVCLPLPVPMVIFRFVPKHPTGTMRLHGRRPRTAPHRQVLIYYLVQQTGLHQLVGGRFP